MNVNVRLMGWLREYLRPDIEQFDDKDFDLAEGITVGRLAEDLGFRAETDFMAMRNGQHVKPEVLDSTLLVEGDVVIYVPPLKGG